ncbi:MAG: T9SS type A sorting domain-containing protein [Flavobacteriales bacterium]|nr:T9SS type A sorting domain-containing protein [Flavobacteriales bacterium]
MDHATTVPETTSGPARLSLWPVPASERLFWNAGGTATDHLEVFDASGRSVAQFNPRTPAGELALEGWQPGAYFLRATFPQGPVTERFAVVR